MAWRSDKERVQHYGDVLQNESAAPRLERNENGRYLCPRCRRARPSFAFVDVRDLPVEISEGYDFACDACWTAWVRENTPHPNRDDGKVVIRTRSGTIVRPPEKHFRGQPLTKANWLRAHGAPEEIAKRFE